MIWDHWAMRRRVESTSGSKDGWGLLYWPTSAKAVTRREPPFGSLQGKKGSRILQWYRHLGAGRHQAALGGQTSLGVLRAYRGHIGGGGRFTVGARRGPCWPLLGKSLRIHCNLGTEGQIRNRTHWAEIGSWLWQPQGECGLGLRGRMRSD